ncbi:TIGR00296 family protein [Candidatus Micrarchaeota archaeon]|nr:TIGR00296 family protein [Candidatus Micrarchaeota archaeon]
MGKGLLSLEDGEHLVSLARRAVESFFEKNEELKIERPHFEKRGVFVTIETFPKKELRGCIGYPYPIKPLEEAVVDSALNAAFGDPRFPSLEKSELEKIVFEVSVLTVPELVEADSPKDYLKKISIGKDGLVIECRGHSGLLLPQVAPENNFSCEEFISHTCLKAGLDGDAWTCEKITLFKFQAQIYCEQTPGGKVIEKKPI